MQTKDLKEINNIFEDIRQAVNTAAGEEVITECDPRNSYAKKIARLSENEETLPFLFDAVVEDDNAETPDVSYHVNEEGTGIFSFRLSRGVAGSEGAPGKDGKDGRDGIDGIDGEKGDKGDPGEDGKDGNRFKFIYLALPDTTIDVAAPVYNPDKDGDLPYFNGVQWTEEPSGVSIAKQIEYVSQSEFTAAGWSKWSYPAVWARWSKDGEPGKNGKDGIGRSIFIYTSTATIDSPETPQGGSWDPETNTITAPEGWFDNVPESRETYLWLSNAFFANDGVTIESWSTPVRLTGENGQDGVDGKDIEFIYRLLPNRDTYSALRKYIDDNPLTSGDDLEVPAVNDNLGIDSVWTNNPSGIDGGNYLIEVVCSRTKKNDVWSAWSLPTYWSMWGEDGMDGAGVEYIFRITSEEFTSDMLLAEFEQHDIYNHPDYQKDNFYPGGNWGVELDWTDEPSDVSETEPLEWVCLRKKIDGVWGEFSEPKVWGKYAKDGYAFKTSYVFTRAISQPEQPHGGTYNEPYPTILGVDGVTIQKDPIWSDTVPAGSGEIYMTYRTFYSGPEIVDEDWSTPVKMTDTAGFQVEYSTRIEKPAIGSLQPYYENYINGVDTREYEIVWREDNTAWSDDGTDAIWMATSVLKGGKWTDWSVVKVKGENGDAGKDGTSIEIKGTAIEVFDALPDTLLIDEAGNEIHYVLFKDWIYKFNPETDTYEKFEAEEIGDGFVVGRNFWIWDGYRWYNAGEIKGADGKSAWFIVKFSDDKIEFTADNGTEPGRYIGMLFGVGAMDENYVNTASNYDWTLWSGDDGWGWEQIFLLTAKDSGYNEDNPPAIPTDNTKVLDHVPEGWTDTPSSVSANFPYCWSAKRKASRSEIEDWKGDPEKPGYASLYTRYAYDGITAFHLELTNDQIVVPVEKDGSIDTDFTEASTRMILYSGDTVVEPTNENPILYTVSAGTVNDGDVTLTREDLKDISTVTCKATYNGTDFYKTLHIIKTDTAYDITVNRAVLTRGEDGYFINGDKELIVNVLRWNADHWYGIDNQGFNVSITHLDGTVDTDESYITVNGKATVTLSDEKDVRSIKIYFIKNGIEYFEEVGVVADGKQGPEGPQGPQGPSGENGTNAFTFDLSNDNDTILTNSDGDALEEMPSTTAKLYYGDEEIVAGIDYTVTVTGGTIDDGLNGVTELITTGGSKSFSFKTITDNKAVMTIKAVYGGISFVKEFTITRIVGTVDYNLKLSNYVVSRNETEGKFLTVIAEKVDHAEKSITFCMFNEDVKVVAKNNTETIELTEYLSQDQYIIPYSVVIDYPIFVLSVDGVDWHTQEVAIVRDGVNGVKGDKGENIIVLSLTRVNGTFLYSETDWINAANEFTSKIQVFDGLVDITNKCTYLYTASTGLDVSIENDIVTIKPGTIARETNVHEVVITAHYGDVDMSKTITVICTPSGKNGNTPYIKDGYWYIDGENTGIKAEGSNGSTPEIGDNGNWWLGGEDTGIPVRGISVESVDVEYAISDSNTEAPTEGWVSEVTGSVDGKFVWSRTKTVYSNGSIDYSKAACISGKDGIGIQSVTEMYYLSTSATELAGGEWVNSYNPEFDDNLFIWTKTVIILSDGTRTETDPIRSSGLPGKDGKDGKDGINGADGVNGKDGTSIVWKGDFAEHLSNPENGWAYHNTTENASFVFFGQWYLMSRDGQNGLDGKDGKDGTSISIKGSLNSESELPTPPANASDCYIIGSDLYIWTGSVWKNVGQFKGDKGDPGKDGVNGADGVNGVDGKDGVSIVWKGEYSSHPSNPQNGWAYKNTTDKKSYIYQDNTWYQMTIDGIDGQNGQDGKDGSDGADGLSIVWKGDLATPPTNPQLNWCYRDTDNGKVYIYNGSAWELMVVDGSDGENGADGTDGLSVFITYHDNPITSIPANPTGNGTTNGWHTNATSTANWMSQKVAESSVSGSWSDPIQICGLDGKDGIDGESFVYIGSGSSWEEVASKHGVSTTPNNGWCYRDTDNGIIYVWDGDNWEIMVEDGQPGADGSNGLDGLSVFVTYNDNSVDSEPSKPTGDGNGNGWHTNATLNVNWMSQKVAATATEGEWGNPILICGRNGADGKAGADGKGIVSTTVEYGISTSENEKPTTWSSTTPVLEGGKYLWTRTTWTYTEGYPETGCTVNYIPKDGQDGISGKDGAPGKDGVSIVSTKCEYAISNNQFTTPSLWSETTPALVGGSYLWTRTTWTYSEGDPEYGFSVNYIPKDGEKGLDGKDGNPGANGKGIKSTTVEYAISTSQSTVPSSWSKTTPTLVGGRYLWTRTTWEYTEGDPEVGYQKTYIPIDGADGADGQPGAPGVGIASTKVEYAISDSGTTKPTTWSETTPVLEGGKYLWTKTTWTYTKGPDESGYSVTYIGTDGTNGTDGETPVIYTLIASSNVVFYTSTGELIKPTAITLTVIKTVGTVATQVHNLTSEGLKLIINNGGSISSQTNLVIGANTITDYARIYLCPSTATNTNYSLNFKSYVEIEAVYNEKGEDGKQGPSGPIIYPAGTFDYTKTYTGTNKKAPYVFFNSDDEEARGYYIAYGTPPQGNDPVDDLITNPDWSNIPTSGGWVKMETYNAIYSDIGVFGHALVGKWVFYEDYMFSQLGINGETLEEATYDLWLGNPIPAGEFIPNIKINARTGEAWFARQNFELGSNGSIKLKNGDIDIRKTIINSNIRFKLDNNGILISYKEFGGVENSIQVTSEGIKIGDFFISEDGGLSYSSNNGGVTINPTNFSVQDAAGTVNIMQENGTECVYANAQFIKSSTNRTVDFRAGSPGIAFQADKGTFAGLRPKVRKVSASVTLDQFDHTVVASGSSTVLTLPSSPLQGQEYWLVCTDGNIQIKSNSTKIFNMYSATWNNQVSNAKRISWHIVYCDSNWYATPIFVAP